MGRLTTYERNRVLVLHRSYRKVGVLHKSLLKEDITISRQALCALLKKFREYGTMEDLPRDGRIPMLGSEHLDFIDHTLHQNPEESARDLRNKIFQTFGINISISTIKRERQKLGWVYTSTRYCQLVRHINMPLRLAFCLECLANRDDFSNVVFSDESSIRMGSSLNKSFRRRNEQRALVSKPKHPLKVHVWAGISVRGATDICIFQGNMNAEFYRTILDTHLLPFLRDVFPDNHRFQQDNDPKHTARATGEWFHDNGVNLWPTPPESPDLNPIENMWAALKRHIRKVTKPRTQQELVNGIQQFWSTVTPEMCRRYIGHLHRVMPVVVARGGGPSGY